MSEARAHAPSPSLLGLIARSLLSRSSPDRAEVARTWGRLCRYYSRALWGLTSRVCQKADLQRIESLAREMASVVERDPACAAKYADYAFWIPFNVNRVGSLGLHQSQPLRILDIGCGPGYFLAAAAACGHECYGIDAPAAVMTAVEQRVYSELLAALSLQDRVSPLLIERFKPMALPVRDLNLITAFWICFNRHEQPDEWSVEEWKFFVQDAMTYLRDGGVLHLELNSNLARYHSLEWYDQATLGFFRSAGTVDRNLVRIGKGKPQGWRQTQNPAQARAG
jgi:SAM-dependent methyltransferase